MLVVAHFSWSNSLLKNMFILSQTFRATMLNFDIAEHFAVYDVETGRSGDDYSPTPQELSEYYLSSFKTCARDAKVGAIMW